MTTPILLVYPHLILGHQMLKLKKKAKSKAAGSNFAIVELLSTINKKLGAEHAVTTLSERSINVPTYPSGLLTLDYLFGTKGVPAGRVIELYGPESSGKTSLALHIISQVQKVGTAGLVDAEHATSPKYAKNVFGVDLSRLIFSQPDSAEQAVDIVKEMCRVCSLVVVDSVAALVPQVELDADTEKNQMGLQARLMGKALRSIVPIASKNKCTVIFINQTRMKIGVMFGNPETTPGGNALKFAASIRVRVSKIKSDVPNAHKCSISVVKNKVGVPFKKAELLLTKNGYDKAFDAVMAGEKTGVLSKSGRSYEMDGETIAPGYNGVLKYFRDSSNRKRLRKLIREGGNDGNSEPDDEGASTGE